VKGKSILLESRSLKESGERCRQLFCIESKKKKLERERVKGRWKEG
jgi:hypothetical protein